MTPETVCYHCNGTKVMRWDGSLIGCDVCGGTGRIPAQESETDECKHLRFTVNAVDGAAKTTCNNCGEELKSPAEAGALDGNDPSIPSTPPSAGEGELDKLPGRLRLSMANLEIVVKDAGDVVRAREVLAAAINAYIARRVLEVIGEDEQETYYAGAEGDGEDYEAMIRNDLRAEQRQRIAVIKKEGQQ